MHTNASMAGRLGLVHSSVSRIRDGKRLPSIDVMVKIEKEFKWKVGEQVAAREKGVYAREFERRCMQQPDPSRVTDPGLKSEAQVPS